MGGIGSGRRWHFHANKTIEEFRSLDVRRLQRDGYLKPNLSFGWQWSRNGERVAWINVRTDFDRIVLDYRHRSNGKEWKDESYPVLLQWTLCNFGGKRPWFICPVSGCGRRVAILYGGRIFACRHCHQLAYPSQRETYDDRAARRADKVREKLGWEPGILNGRSWTKPKGMHQRTFERLLREHDSLISEALSGFSQRFGFKL